MARKEGPTPLTGRLRLYTLLLAIVWTLLLAGAHYYQTGRMRSETVRLARNEAGVHFEWMRTFRSWVASHGGVYVPITKATPPNPYLKAEEREIVTPLGKKLTLVNPAYMTRLVFEDFSEVVDMRGHLTSLNPLRPANSPDIWERAALEGFDKGERERTEFTTIDGAPYLRMMRPLYVRKSCLLCHAVQGYKEGEVRGGMSIAVPLTDFYARETAEIGRMEGVQFLLWVVGLGIITFGSRNMGGLIVRRERAERESRRLAMAVEHTGEIVMVTDTEGVIEYVNPAFERCTGYTHDEVVGEHSRLLKSGRHDDAFYKEMWETISSGGTWEENIINKRRDGSFSEEKTIISPVTGDTGNIIGYVAIKHDVTGEALLSKAKEYFAKATSQELRTPIHKLNMARLLFDTAAEAGDETVEVGQGRKILEEVSAEIEQLLSSTTLLTDLASGVTIPLLPLRIRPLLELSVICVREGCLREKRSVFCANDIDAIPADVTILGNQEMLQKVFEEVISNAVKYTPDDKKVSLSSRLVGSLLEVCVEDQGQGVPPDKVESLFDSFYSGEEAHKLTSGKYTFNRGGVGLGLTIARMIMDYHHGSITLAPSVGGVGTCVTLTFPVATPTKA